MTCGIFSARCNSLFKAQTKCRPTSIARTSSPSAKFFFIYFYIIYLSFRKQPAVSFSRRSPIWGNLVISVRQRLNSVREEIKNKLEQAADQAWSRTLGDRDDLVDLIGSGNAP